MQRQASEKEQRINKATFVSIYQNNWILEYISFQWGIKLLYLDHFTPTYFTLTECFFLVRVASYVHQAASKIVPPFLDNEL